MSSCNIKECYKCNNNIASWMPISPSHLNKEKIGEVLINKYIKYYSDLINELKKISLAYRIDYDRFIETEDFEYSTSLDIKEQLEYYYSLFEEEIDDEFQEEEDY